MGKSTTKTTSKSTLPTHGGSRLPFVDVDSYNLEVKDEDGFLGDRVNKKAFRVMVEDLRKPLRKAGDDPLGEKPSSDLRKGELDELLIDGEPEAAGVIQGAIEEFAKEFAFVLRRFLKLNSWSKTQRIVIGGGFRDSRVGEVALGRAGLLLKSEDVDIELVPIANDPDDAGLIGAAYLAPSWMLKGYNGILALDIGGTNFRAGVLEIRLKETPERSKVSVWKSDIWCHAEEKKLTRDDAVKRLVRMVEKLIAQAVKEGFNLAPFIGVGCPGVINEDGTIERGAQNLPGNWESKKFNLPALLREAIPKIGDHDTSVLMHNDAVVQGLSELANMRDVERWGVITIGTGLGNARFSNRAED
jgi:predicted NBD/HSP70 family sugar kinase